MSKAQKLHDQGLEALQRGDGAAAVRLYTQAIEQCPAGAVPAGLYVFRSHAHLACDEYEKALEDADHAVRLAPIDSMAHTARGAALMFMCQRGDDRFDEARAAYRRALELDPSNEVAEAGSKGLKRLAAERKAPSPSSSQPPMSAEVKELDAQACEAYKLGDHAATVRRQLLATRGTRCEGGQRALPGRAAARRGPGDASRRRRGLVRAAGAVARPRGAGGVNIRT